MARWKERWPDLAAGEPLRILRRSGQSYILVNENEMHKEIVSIQRRLIALAQTSAGATAQEDRS